MTKSEIIQGILNPGIVAVIFINAGCVALAAGSSLIGKEALKNKDWKKITATAAAFVKAIKNARSGKK